MAALYAFIIFACMTSSFFVRSNPLPSGEDVADIPPPDPNLDFVPLLEEVSENEIPQKRTTSDPENQIKICFFCDEHCNYHISGDGNKEVSKEFLRNLTTETSTILGDLGTYSLQYHFTLLPDKKVYLYWYVNGDTSPGSIMTANTGFWQTHSLYPQFRSHGCEVGFYASYPDDYVLRLSSGVEAVASFGQVCTNYGHGIIKIHRQLNINHMATYLAHELGHLLGAFHDGDANSDYVESTELQNGAADELDAVIQTCTPDSGHCSSDASQYCVMNSVPISGTGYSRTYSDCSRAQVALWIAMTDIFPGYYSDDCLQEGNVAKRNIAVRETSDENTVNFVAESDYAVPHILTGSLQESEN